MNPRETAIKMLAQATDPGVGEHEARTFALKAAKLIVEHKLLDGSTGPFSGLGAILAGLPLERIMGNVNTMALGASAMEILSLKAEIQRLQTENDALRAKKKKRRML